jgi:UDP-N-acetylmuramate dehydrogenase
MTALSVLATELRSRVRGAVRENEPLAPRSTIRLGGAAEVWFEPHSAEELVVGLRLFREGGVPVRVLGGGANTLISDAGLPGAVVHLTPGFDLGVHWPAELEVELSAGLTGMKALQAARSRGLVGPEFLVGIPGTLGGQVAMNAGTKRGQMGDLLTAVQVASADGLAWLPVADLKLAYRHSELPKDSIVTRLRLRFSRGDVAQGDAQLKEDLDYRRRTQPWEKPNLGSTFRNPPGDFAGRLLEASGLRGERVGQVAFSDVHANFLVNLGGGKAQEAHALIDKARRRVAEAAGVSLILEVALAGEF